MSVRLKEQMLYKSNIHLGSAVWLCWSETSEGGLFLVPEFWVLKCLLSSSDRKWQEASQQIQTLQASQSLLSEYEQKIKVRKFLTYIKL